MCLFYSHLGICCESASLALALRLVDFGQRPPCEFVVADIVGKPLGKFYPKSLV